MTLSTAPLVTHLSGPSPLLVPSLGAFPSTEIKQLFFMRCLYLPVDKWNYLK